MIRTPVSVAPAGQPLSPQPGRRRRAWAATALLATAAVLSGCGGSSAVEAFIPERLVVFGDESSVLTSDGHKYTVNTLKSDGSLDCAANPTWMQYVASQAYGMHFEQCLGTAAAGSTAAARSYAEVGGVAAGLPAQIANYESDASSKHLAMIWMGTNDIVQIYENAAYATQDAKLAEAKLRGQAIAGQVARLSDKGVKVIVLTALDLGHSPYALSKGSAAAAQIKAISTALNDGLRTTIPNDGRKVGLVLADEMVQAAVQNQSAFGFGNIKDAACAATLPNCTTKTLVTGASDASWMWADATRPGHRMHLRIGALAASRAQNNPF